MLNHTKKIKGIYEDIQKKLFYMIPEKWDKLYLYSSVIDLPKGKKTGELYFYYIPKGIFKKKPVNVYEIPAKFNLAENEYIRLVKVLYDKIKLLREEFRKSETGDIWSNITLTIENLKFKVTYKYDDLENSPFDSYERHVIWRYENLNIGPEQLGKKDKEILNRYLLGARTLDRSEVYESGIYIKDIENIVAYNPNEKFETTKNVQNVENSKNSENLENENVHKMKNQILLSIEEAEKLKNKRKIIRLKNMLLNLGEILE